MGLMDKVKVQYEQAVTKAQQGVNQGKAKFDQAQAKHQWDALLRNLGAAVWAEQREGGSSDAVTAALAALDAHLAAHAGADEDGPAESAEATSSDTTTSDTRTGGADSPAETSAYEGTSSGTTTETTEGTSSGV
jgi:hypothetical protein